MSDTARLQLPLLEASQAQKHVTVNESLLIVDALVQMAVLSATTSAQPAAPADGDLYILPAGKTGADWGPAADGALAHYRDGVWAFHVPREGWLAFVQDTDRLAYFTGMDWSYMLADLLTGLAATGVVARTGPGAYAARTIQGTASKVTVTNGDGVAGNPTLSLPDPVELGTGRISGGTAATPGLTPSGDTDTGLFAPAADTLAWAIGGTERMRLTTRLTLTGPTNSEILRLGTLGSMGQFGGGYFSFASNAYSFGNAFDVKNVTGNTGVGMGIVSPMRTDTSATQGAIFVGAGQAAADTTVNLSAMTKALSWDTSGRVGIGKTPSASNRLDVNGTISVNDTILASTAGHLQLRAYTIATLPSASVAGQLIYCSDLGGGGGLLVSDGINWRRARESGSAVVATDANFTLTPLSSAPEQYHTGTLTADRTITLATTNVYDGCRFRVTRTGAGAFNLSLGGLKNLASNTWVEAAYSAAAGAWKLAATGTL